MLYYLGVVPGAGISVPDVKAVFAYLARVDADRPPKSKQIEWCADITTALRRERALSDYIRVISRSSAPVPVPTLVFKVQSAVGGGEQTAILELVDGDIRKSGLPFDFLDNVWFRFNDQQPMTINGLTDEDWILARLADTNNLLIEG